jgi:thiamine biosynthesis protein ThiS
MQIVLNGAAFDTSALTIEALVAELGFTRGTVLVEHNGIALRPNEWGHTSLGQGDRLEILRIVAGG